MGSAVSRQGATNLLTWPVLASVFVAWPLMSCFPVFSIIQNEKTAGWITLQLLFLGSSFWGVGTVLAFTAATLQPEARAAFRKALSGKAGLLAWYALAWMAAYGAASTLLAP